MTEKLERRVQFVVPDHQDSEIIPDSDYQVESRNHRLMCLRTHLFEGSEYLASICSGTSVHEASIERPCGAYRVQKKSLGPIIVNVAEKGILCLGKLQICWLQI